MKPTRTRLNLRIGLVYDTHLTGAPQPDKRRNAIRQGARQVFTLNANL